MIRPLLLAVLPVVEAQVRSALHRLRWPRAKLFEHLTAAEEQVSMLKQVAEVRTTEKERLERALAIETRQSEERLARLLAAESKAMEADRLLKAAAADASSVRSGRDAALDERDRARKETDAIRANLNALKDLAKECLTTLPDAGDNDTEQNTRIALRKWIADYEEIPF